MATQLYSPSTTKRRKQDGEGALGDHWEGCLRDLFFFLQRYHVNNFFSFSHSHPRNFWKTPCSWRLEQMNYSFPPPFFPLPWFSPEIWAEYQSGSIQSALSFGNLMNVMPHVGNTHTQMHTQCVSAAGCQSEISCVGLLLGNLHNIPPQCSPSWTCSNICNMSERWYGVKCNGFIAIEKLGW